MIVRFSSHKLERSVSSVRDVLKNYGSNAKRVLQRIDELKAVPTLYELRSLPQANCHELRGNRNAEFAVDTSANHRIVFEVDHEPIPRSLDGGIDWKSVTEIVVTAINVDYH